MNKNILIILAILILESILLNLVFNLFLVKSISSINSYNLLFLFVILASLFKSVLSTISLTFFSRIAWYLFSNLSYNLYLQRNLYGRRYRTFFWVSGAGCGAIHFISLVHGNTVYRCRNKFARLSWKSQQKRIFKIADTKTFSSFDTCAFCISMDSGLL